MRRRLLYVVAILILACLLLPLAGCGGQKQQQGDAAGGSASSPTAAGSTSPPAPAAGSTSPSTPPAAGSTSPSTPPAAGSTSPSTPPAGPPSSGGQAGKGTVTGSYQTLVANQQLGMTVHQAFYAEMIAGGLGTLYTPSTPGNVFCLVDVEFSNLSQGTIKINPLDVVMQDSGGNRYGKGIGLIVGPPPEIQDLNLTDLGAGQKVRGTLLFSVPATEPPSRQVRFTRTSPELAVDIAGQGVHLAGPAAQPGPVTRSGVELTVLEWRTTDKVSSASWTSSAPEGKILFVVTVRVKNTSRAPTFTMNPLNCVLKDSAGNSYIHSMVALGLANRLTLTELAPGQSAEGAIMYVVPKDASIVEVWYKTGALGGPLAVRLQ